MSYMGDSPFHRIDSYGQELDRCCRSGSEARGVEQYIVCTEEILDLTAFRNPNFDTYLERVVRFEEEGYSGKIWRLHGYPAITKRIGTHKGL